MIQRCFVVLLVLLVVPLAVPAPARSAAFGGPVVLMGIDAEDGGPGGHGPVSTYSGVVGDVLSNVGNSGSGLLVLGGGKAAGDHVTSFWDALAADLGVPVSYANGSAIGTVSFAGVAVLAVASSSFQTPSGGLTNAENDLLTTRGAEIRDFVNLRGGLVGSSQDALNTPYGYLQEVGSFTFNRNLGYSAVTPTNEGRAMGITDGALDVCCWHDEYITFPGFFDVLVTNDMTGNPAAIGGLRVSFDPDCTADELEVTVTEPVVGRAYVDGVDQGTAPGSAAVVHGTVLHAAATTSSPADTVEVLFALGSQVTVDATAPYEATFDATALPAGTHDVLVKAFHTSGCSAKAAVPVEIRCFDLTPAITRPVQGRIYLHDIDVGPSGGAPLALQGLLTLHATSPDVAHTQEIRFAVDGGALGSDPSDPYTAVLDVDPLVPGAHVIAATLVEVNPSCERTVEVTIRKPDPSVSATAQGARVGTNVPAEPVVLVGGAEVGKQGGDQHVRILDEAAGVLDHVHAVDDVAHGENGDGTLDASALSEVTDVSLLGGMITAKLLRAEATAAFDLATSTPSVGPGDSRIVDLRIAGEPVVVSEPNLVVPLPGGLGRVVLQETLPVVDGVRGEMTVNMIHAFVDQGVWAGEVVVASAHAGVNLAQNLFTGPDNDLIHRPDDADSGTDAGDSEADAIPIEPGPYSGSFTPGDDVDVYAFDARQGHRVVATVKPAERTVLRVNPVPQDPSLATEEPAARLILRDPDGDVRARSLDGIDAVARAEINADEPWAPQDALGRWTLEVQRIEGSPDGFYSLELDRLPNPLREQEDAGVPGDASDACAGARPIAGPPAHDEVEEIAFAGVIRDDDTADHYAFDAEIGQEMSIVLKPDEGGDGADLDLYLYGPSTPGGPVDCGSPIAASTAGKSVAKALPEVIAQLPVDVTGSYVLEVRRHNAVANYYVNVEVVSPMPTAPANDAGTGSDAAETCLAADPVDVGLHQGRLGDVPTDDTADQYRIDLQPGEDLTAVLKPAELADMDLELFDPACQPVPPDELTHNGQPLSAPETVHIESAAGGAYRLHVSRRQGGNYLLGIVVSP